MKTATILYGAAAGIWVAVATPALAQRVQFSTPLPPEQVSAGKSAIAAATPTYSQPAQPPNYAPSIPPGSYSPPTPPPTYSLPPSYSQPPSGRTYSYPAAPNGYGAPVPGAALEGTIQTPPPQWDPYGTPSPEAAPLLPQDPYYQGGGPGFTVASMQRFLQRVGVDYHWFAGNGDNELGINDVELSATFAFPFFYNTQCPLLITPGFATHFWNGPVSTGPNPADLPPQTFDAYLDAAWNPQVTPWFGGELSFRTGVYSDFKKIDTDSLRFMGKGLAVLTFSPSIKLKAGVWYLDRNRVKLLPAGGIVWTPNPDWRFDILFPNPKLSRHLTTYGTTEWWGYLSGDYGGGNWSITRADVPLSPVAGQRDRVDYNDMRVAVGVEFIGMGGLHGLFEVGYAFERELVYASGSPDIFRPNTTVYLRGGLAY